MTPADLDDRSGKSVAFCAASRLALGNLQRATNVAAALAERRPEIALRLLTNSARGAEWATQSAIFREVAVADRTAMSASLERMKPAAVVVGAFVVPDLETIDAPLCLILREVIPAKLAGFRLKGGRPWDLVIAPNPAADWVPDPDVVAARRFEAVGWIYRRPDPSRPGNTAGNGRFTPVSGRATVLVASGGGSGDDEHDALTEEIAGLIAGLRRSAVTPLSVVQARGPNAQQGWSIPGVDETIEPGPELHNLFARADLVISTAGYNSVLEIACTDVPALLVPIGRYSDDQYKRAQEWGPRVGRCYEPGDREQAIQWMVGVVDGRSRRTPYDPGPSGASACAALIEELL